MWVAVVGVFEVSGGVVWAAVVGACEVSGDEVWVAAVGVCEVSGGGVKVSVVVVRVVLGDVWVVVDRQWLVLWGIVVDAVECACDWVEVGESGDVGVGPSTEVGCSFCISGWLRRVLVGGPSSVHLWI